MCKKRRKVPLRRPKGLAREGLKAALSRQTKAELVALVMEAAGRSQDLRKTLERRFEVALPLSELIRETEAAISIATEIDEGKLNSNFSYDMDAYEEVLRNFKTLIAAGRLKETMELAVELMKQGSYQVECSDEGLMSEEIEDCLQVVVKAISKSDLPPQTVRRWCDTLSRADRVGFLCNREITALKSER